MRQSGMAVSLWIGLLAVGLALLWNAWRKNAQLKLPPGPPGLPVLGNLLLFSGSQLPHHALNDLAKQYGPLMFLRLGSSPCVVINSPEACKAFFKDQDKLFASRPVIAAAKLMIYNATNIGFTPYGDRWRYLRRISFKEILSSKRLAQLESARADEVSAMLTAIHHDSILNEGETVNVRHMLKALSFNFLTHICVSKRFCAYKSRAAPPKSKGPDVLNEINPEEGEEFTHLVDELFYLLGTQLIGDHIPCLSFLDRFSGVKARMVQNHRRLDEFLSRILETHKQNPKATDFLDHLLRIPQANDGPDQMDDVTIKALCMDVIVAGLDTLSNTLEWAITEIIRHPGIQVKLHAEMDSVVGKDKLVTEADIPRLPYLQAFVKELLRFHPVSPLGVFHYNHQPTKVMGYDIPPKTIVFTNLWGIGRDPAVWDNPMELRPERFIERPDIDVRGQHYELLAFGTGRRQCPGMNMGLTMVQYCMARLIQGFSWSPPEGMQPEDVDIEERGGLSLPRAHDLEAVPTSRLPYELY
eukprot:TRINITY_DN6892_c0_g1_i1.p1 TRINITY_DN6892_c0_g1~~TRINITY_DN6892_c0_g1_i1.p1  ORF type:complete len:526 (-),score=72.56 TRINITY_DN6892_c0_g1_i1:47-1624(-)